jgi:hypothetical protein
MGKRMSQSEYTQKATTHETAVKPVLAVVSGTVESPIVLDHESKNSVSEAHTESDEGANPGSKA